MTMVRNSDGMMNCNASWASESTFATRARHGSAARSKPPTAQDARLPNPARGILSGEDQADERTDDALGAGIQPSNLIAPVAVRSIGSHITPHSPDGRGFGEIATARRWTAPRHNLKAPAA